MNENEETFYAGMGIYGIRDKVTKKTISLDDKWMSNSDLDRSELMELGRKGPFFLFVDFQVEVTTEIEVIAKGEAEA